MAGQPDEEFREAISPVSREESRPDESGPEEGIALCLSGGGYRAMIFHLGALMRLNEVSLLPKLKRISSVSGGSITAGVLGLHWSKLKFVDGVATNLNEEVVVPVRNLAGRTIDAPAIVLGALLPGRISGRIIRVYQKRLFGKTTLQELPSDNEGPRFVINATNVQSGTLWRFSKPYMADYQVGQAFSPEVRLAVAVAASSAFPPFLSPVIMKTKQSDFKSDKKCLLQHPPFTTRVVLSDGGVYDNLGLETAWKRYKTVLVSDAGGAMPHQGKPWSNWACHSYRVLQLIDNQVRSLRKRQLIAGYIDPNDSHDGTYWGIRTQISHYGLTTALPCPADKTLALANLPTRLKKMDRMTQEKLIDWGYAVCDAALRRHFDPSLPAPSAFPYSTGVG